jgi:TonB family protein
VPAEFVAARQLYEAAEYDRALLAFDRILQASAGGGDHVAIQQYRAFCFLALGRLAEAEAALAAAIKADPLRQLDDAGASPRIAGAFREARERLLPEILEAEYSLAKSAFEDRNYAVATEGFTRVLALLNDPILTGRHADLRLIVAGFIDLGNAYSAQQRGSDSTPTSPSGDTTGTARPAARPAVTAPVTSPVVKAGGRIYTAADGDVVPPRMIRQELPGVPDSVGTKPGMRAVIELLIDERGRVTSAAVREKVHPAYDAMMLAAAHKWQYEPATRDGIAVRYRKLVQIPLPRTGSAPGSK